MADNRVVEGRMVTPEALAELIEGEDVMDAEPITSSPSMSSASASGVTIRPSTTRLSAISPRGGRRP